MIHYDLTRAHPRFAPMIREIIGALVERYPWAPLHSVRVYEPPLGDRSMGNTKDGVISLNEHWFGADPRDLQDAALARHDILLRRLRVSWHGGMTAEPIHLLSHEFGHALAPAIPGCRAFARDARAAALLDPSLAISGYGLVDDDEYWAEIFAACELGKASGETRRQVMKLLDER